MRKTFEAIDSHVDAESAYLPLREEAAGCIDSIPEIDGPLETLDEIEDTIRELDPDVIVQNHRFRHDEQTVTREYSVVHVRHGCSIGRGEKWNTTNDLDDVVDTALAPGEHWARHYRAQFPDHVRIPVVGIPEADEFVGAEPPRERRILYAPTNCNYGGGSYCNTAEHVLDTFADTEYELVFRPHPMDRIEEPGKTVTERCKTRIADLPNVTFDETETPRERILESDVLISDYSGIVTEWLHTGRPFVQLTNVAADVEVPELGYTTDELSLDEVDDLYERGFRERRNSLGIPMDGRASERAATEVMACTQ